MKLGFYTERGERYKRMSFAQLYIWKLIEDFEHDKKLLLSVSDMAQMTGHTYSRILEIVKQLLEGEYISRIKNFNPEDTRKIYYYSGFDLNFDEYNYYGYDKYLRGITK